MFFAQIDRYFITRRRKMDYKINQDERNALKGLPHLPRLVYLEALRPYMDFATGFVGIKRGVSYQSLSEELYVEPHTGYESGSPSRQQMRRAVKTLEREGLVAIQSEGKRLVLHCPLATSDYSAQNKADTNQTQQGDTKAIAQNTAKIGNYAFISKKDDTGSSAQADIPPVSDNYFIFLRESFEKFWQLYPVKQSKQKAWNVFQNLSPTAELLNQIIDALEKQIAYRLEAAAHNHWMPNWRHAANWLMQHGWEDELPELTFLSEKVNASSAKNKSTKQSGDALWEYCKDAFTEEHVEPSNIINLFKQKQRAY